MKDPGCSRVVLPVGLRLPITRPCPIDVELRDGHCDHCRRDVVDLSAMTQAQARKRLAQRGDAPMCVEYWARPDGTIRFAPPKATAAAAIPLLAIALSGCAAVPGATHGHPAPEITDTRADGCPVDAYAPSTPESLVPGVDPALVTVVDIEIDPRDQHVRGGIGSTANEQSLYDRDAEPLDFVPTKKLLRDARRRRHDRPDGH